MGSRGTIARWNGACERPVCLWLLLLLLLWLFWLLWFSLLLPVVRGRFRFGVGVSLFTWTSPSSKMGMIIPGSVDASILMLGCKVSCSRRSSQKAAKVIDVDDAFCDHGLVVILVFRSWNRQIDLCEVGGDEGRRQPWALMALQREANVVLLGHSQVDEHRQTIALSMQPTHSVQQLGLAC